jgi:flagellar protein FlaF
LYGQARSLKAPRDLEYEVFARVTGRLRRSQGAVGPGAMPERIAALDENRRLWTILAIDLAAPGNALPADLRARLLYLADYSLQTTDRILSGEPTAALLDSLIEINTIVMRGLQPTGGGGAR